MTEKRPSILCILHIPPPINGAAMVGQFIKESDIVNNRYDVDYLNLTTSFDLNSIGKGGLRKLVTIAKIQSNVLKALLKKDYKLVYMTLTARGAGFYKDFLVVLILKLFGKNIIYHFHNKGVKSNSTSFVNRLLYRFTFKNTRSILLSPSLYFDISDYVDKDNVYFCPNGMPELKLTDRTQNRINNLNQGSPCKLFFLSNMMEEKGVIVLLEACRELLKRKVQFECHFVGAWSDVTESRFNKIVNEFGLNGKVFAHGKKYNGDKIEFFQMADIFVFPTYYHNECFPLVLIEAMQFYLPIVSTPEGAIPDMVVDGKSGYLIPQKDSNALADKLQQLIKDESLRSRMGDEGHNRYKSTFTLQDFESNISAIFGAALLKA